MTGFSAAYQRRPKLTLLIGLLVGLALFAGVRNIYRSFTMPPPLVFLIPDDYIGPVFFFFNQPDGVDVMPDPLGQAVKVPDYGVVKLRKGTDDLVPEYYGEKRSVYMVSVSKSGVRSLMPAFLQGYDDDNRVFHIKYSDENNIVHEILKPDDKTGVEVMPPELVSKRSIRRLDGCRHQAFVPNPEKVASGEIDERAAGAPDCGKFLVMSSIEYDRYFKDIFDASYDGLYSSIDELIVENKKLRETIKEQLASDK